MSERIYKLTITHFKILDTVSSLNERHLYPNNEGIYKIVSGQDDEEARMYADLLTYGTLTSYNSKKISRLCIMLLRYKYLAYAFDRESNKLYFQITEKGKIALFDFHKRHKKPYVKPNKVNKPTIVEIL